MQAVSITTYVVANFETGTTPNSTGSKDYVAQTYYIYCSLYVDGKKVKELHLVAKAKSENVTFSSSGVGSASHWAENPLMR